MRKVKQTGLLSVGLFATKRGQFATIYIYATVNGILKAACNYADTEAIVIDSGNLARTPPFY